MGSMILGSTMPMVYAENLSSTNIGDIQEKYDSVLINMEAVLEDVKLDAYQNMKINVGEVKEILKDKDNNIKGILLKSDESGEIVINIDSKTLCVDNNTKSKFNIESLKVGETVYAYRSMAETRSIPAQTQGYVVVRNVKTLIELPTFCYVESINAGAGLGETSILTEDGGLYATINEESVLKDYLTDKGISVDDLKVGTAILRWNGPVAMSYPGQTMITSLVVVPDIFYHDHNIVEDFKITRGAFIQKLYEMRLTKDYYAPTDKFKDVPITHSSASAISWALAHNYMGGYGSDIFGVDDFISLEQAITVLWRVNGSPMLMDYMGLGQYKDVNEISKFAVPSMNWAHEQGLLNKESDELNPTDSLTAKQLQELIDKLY